MFNFSYRALVNLIILPFVITAITSESFINIKSVQSFAQTRVSNLISLWPRRPPRKPKTSRGGSVCLISPPYDTYIVWHDRPLFLWKYTGTDKQVKLVVREYEGNQKTVWEQPVALAAQKISYNQDTPLEAGKLYQWRLINAENNSDSITDWRTIQVMSLPERNQIQSDLQVLEKKLKAAKAPSEEVALQKANYFSNYKIEHQNSTPRNLWSDVLQSLHEVDSPSTEYIELLKQYTNNFCEKPQ